MKIISEQNLGRVSFFLTLIVVSAIIFASGVFFVVRTHESALADLAAEEQRLIEQEKLGLKADVDAFLLRIRSLSERFAAIDGQDTEDAAGGQDGKPAAVPDPGWDGVVDALHGAADLDGAGYFIYQLHDPQGGEHFATMLFNPARPDLVGQPLSTDFPDAKGFNFRKVFLQDIRDHGDSFVVYHYNTDEETEAAGSGSVARKLAYFRLYPEAGWIVAKSIRMEWIDQLIASRQAALKAGNERNLIILGLIFLGGTITALILAYLFSLGTRPIFEHYRARERESVERYESLQKTLEKQNRADTLTRAFNRSHFNQELVKEMTRSDRYGTPLSMMLLDLDDFKSFNNQFGCEVGDTLLVELAELIMDNIRHTDMLARWGGEEFAILAPGIDLGHARMFAEKLRRLIEEHLFSVEHRITCSFGVCCYLAAEGQRPFMQRADEALGRAKAGGKNRCIAV
ncbi:MAG: diguanylate cyclase [Desulfofustis sp.]|nr:diguanylate cyclase [Desulfofustis sp.]